MQFSEPTEESKRESNGIVPGSGISIEAIVLLSMEITQLRDFVFLRFIFTLNCVNESGYLCTQMLVQVASDTKVLGPLGVTEGNEPPKVLRAKPRFSERTTCGLPG